MHESKDRGRIRAEARSVQMELWVTLQVHALARRPIPWEAAISVRLKEGRILFSERGEERRAVNVQCGRIVVGIPLGCSCSQSRVNRARIHTGERAVNSQFERGGDIKHGIQF